jgi:hypothetical protein
MIDICSAFIFALLVIPVMGYTLRDAVAVFIVSFLGYSLWQRNLLSVKHKMQNNKISSTPIEETEAWFAVTIQKCPMKEAMD